MQSHLNDKKSSSSNGKSQKTFRKLTVKGARKLNIKSSIASLVSKLKSNKSTQPKSKGRTGKITLDTNSSTKNKLNSLLGSSLSLKLQNRPGGVQYKPSIVPNRNQSKNTAKVTKKPGDGKRRKKQKPAKVPSKPSKTITVLKKPSKPAKVRQPTLNQPNVRQPTLNQPNVLQPTRNQLMKTKKRKNKKTKPKDKTKSGKKEMSEKRKLLNNFLQNIPRNLKLSRKFRIPGRKETGK